MVHILGAIGAAIWPAHAASFEESGVDSHGLQHLPDGQLAFTLDRSEAGGPVRRWVWVPETGQVVLDGEATTFLTRARSSEARALRDAFHDDAWWLNPAIHVLWAGSDVTVRDGVMTFPDGDVHRFEPDGDGRLSRVRYAPGKGGESLVATFSDYHPVGPLWLAKTRTLERDGSTVSIALRDVQWTSGGTGIALSASAEPFLTVFPDRCRLEDARITRRILPESSYGPAWTDPDGPVDASLWVRPADAPAVRGRFSTETLQLASDTWLRESGVLGCDFHVLEVDSLRAILESATDPERRAILTILLAWHLDETRHTVLSSLVVEKIRRSARECASSGACERLYTLLDRDLPDGG